MYKEIYKNVFIDGYKQLDVMENRNCFLIKIEELKPYIVEFNKDSVIKIKNYPLSCTIREKEYYLVIIITYNECTFLQIMEFKKHKLEKETHFYNLKDKAKQS